VLPPPAEQKRIVAKVDELMALCDRLEAQQQERDEQASALARASLSRFAEAPHAIPPTWVWTMLGEITDIGTGSTPSRGEIKFWTNGTIPWITSGSTSKSSITEGDEFITAAAVKAHRLRIYPSATLLVALYGQGKTRGQVSVLNISATINQACAAICPLDGIPPMHGYIKLHLEKQYDEMRLQSAGGAQPNLNVQKIKEVFVSLPPRAEVRPFFFLATFVLHEIRDEMFAGHFAFASKHRNDFLTDPALVLLEGEFGGRWVA
jgi:type I restriction enzyme S subunit